LEGRKIVTIENSAAPALDDIKVHVKFKLFALWSAVMFCYIYGDYFELYQPGKLEEMIAGRMPLGAVTQGVLMKVAVVMAIPSLMGFVSLVVSARVNRWLNIIFGAIYTVIMILAIRGGWRFYVFFGLVEITLTALIVWYAWTWPRQPPRERV
jgi:hypothetical protein